DSAGPARARAVSRMVDAAGWLRRVWRVRRRHGGARGGGGDRAAGRTDWAARVLLRDGRPARRGSPGGIRRAGGQRDHDGGRRRRGGQVLRGRRITGPDRLSWAARSDCRLEAGGGWWRGGGCRGLTLGLYRSSPWLSCGPRPRP